jgi:hypothetical protein
MNYLRAGVRIQLELPARVKWKSRTGRSREAEGKTACISANGLLVTAPVRLRDQTPITITVNLPVEVTKIPLQLLCQGRVVSQRAPAKTAGIGVIIDHYQFQPVRRPV